MWFLRRRTLGSCCAAQEVARPHWRIVALVGGQLGAAEWGQGGREAAGSCQCERYTHEGSRQPLGQPALIGDQGASGYPSPSGDLLSASRASQAEWVVKQKVVPENEQSAIIFAYLMFFFSTEALYRERILNVSSEGLGFHSSLSHSKFLANLSNLPASLFLHLWNGD